MATTYYYHTLPRSKGFTTTRNWDDEDKYYFFLTLGIPVFYEQVVLLMESIERSKQKWVDEIISIESDGYGSFRIRTKQKTEEEMEALREKVEEWFYECGDESIYAMASLSWTYDAKPQEIAETKEGYLKEMEYLSKAAGYKYDEEFEAECWDES